MHIGIRVDAGRHHGMGHLIRMRALASALQDQGCTVSFISHTPDVAPLVAPLQTYPLHCRDILNSLNVLVVDTKDPMTNEDAYGWQRKCGMKMVCVDNFFAQAQSWDLAVAPHCHWAPDDVEGVTRAFGNRFLYGLDYVLLEDHVITLKHSPKPVVPPIVFCAGGSDPHGMVMRFREWTRDLWPDIEKRYCLGLLAEQPDDDIFKEKDIHLFAHRHLAEAHTVVGMFGMTCYECLCYGVPMLVCAHTLENETGALQLMRQTGGRIRYVGNILYDTDQTLRRLFRSCLRNLPSSIPPLPDHVSIDGQGARRVAEAILAL